MNAELPPYIVPEQMGESLTYLLWFLASCNMIIELFWTNEEEKSSL